MAFPSTIDAPAGTAAQGGSLLTAPDHALDHRTLGSAVVAIENKLGLGAGSAALNQILVGGGSGTAQWGTTWNQGNLGSPTATSGTLINTVLGTPSIDAINARNSGSAIIFRNSLTPNVGSLVDTAGGTLTPDAAASNYYISVMGTAAGNRTIGTPSNANVNSPELLTLGFKTSGSANGTLVWSGAFRISQDAGTPALGTGVSWNYFTWRYNIVDSKWDFLGQIKNLV